jgi:hypothetical protein
MKGFLISAAMAQEASLSGYEVYELSGEFFIRSDNILYEKIDKYVNFIPEMVDIPATAERAIYWPA